MESTNCGRSTGNDNDQNNMPFSGNTMPPSPSPVNRVETPEEKRVRWTKETEWTKKLCDDVATNRGCDSELRCLARTLVCIIGFWQSQAGDKEPSHHPIKLHQDTVTVTLLQVFALVPAHYQWMVLVNMEERARDGDPSWLCESIMEVLVVLNRNRQVNANFFAPAMASMARGSLDDYYQDVFPKSYLEYVVNEVPDDKEDWVEGRSFKVPPATESIVYFYNYTEEPWTVGVIGVHDNKWKHSLLDSFTTEETKGPLFKSFKRHSGHFQTLIQTASGLPLVKGSVYSSGKSAQQYNTNDCGVIAVYNAIQILNGATRQTGVDTTRQRLGFLEDVLKKLKTLPQPGSTNVDAGLNSPSGGISLSAGTSSNSTTSALTGCIDTTSDDTACDSSSGKLPNGTTPTESATATVQKSNGSSPPRVASWPINQEVTGILESFEVDILQYVPLPWPSKLVEIIQKRADQRRKKSARMLKSNIRRDRASSV
ncbi:hypothetical protein PVAG01_00603 [Phlyctema vagabunda]|uniref:Ubiquitin-like protease family profile domain-containing protein n=1 Tax=Phlyctema vagabunda TaxID=108571 RepID=A0ABR4PUP8_9HELO